MTLTNRFGLGELYSMYGVVHEQGICSDTAIYCESSACMSVTSDMLSWISAQCAGDLPLFVSSNRAGNNNVVHISKDMPICKFVVCFVP